MTNINQTRRLTAAAMVLVCIVAGLSCARQHPRRNTQSDLIAFSHIESAWASSKGAGVTVAIVDWQFDPKSTAAGHYVAPASMIPGEKMGDLKPWHGSWMVDIVHRIAPEARIMPIIGKSLRQKGFQDSLIQGIRYAAEHGAVAVTCSMGLVDRSRALREAVDAAEQLGTLFVNVHPENVAPAGQSFQPCGPGDCDRRIVHAGIVSVPEHPVKPHPSRDVYTWPYDLDAKYEDGWGYSNGPPIVAGVIALVKSANPRLSPAQIRELLVQTATDRDGFKVLDAEAAVKAALAAR